MSTHNIYFCGEIRKKFYMIPLFSRARYMQITPRLDYAILSALCRISEYLMLEGFICFMQTAHPHSLIMTFSVSIFIS